MKRRRRGTGSCTAACCRAAGRRPEKEAVGTAAASRRLLRFVTSPELSLQLWHRLGFDPLGSLRLTARVLAHLDRPLSACLFSCVLYINHAEVAH